MSEYGKVEDVSHLLMASVYPDLFRSLFIWPPGSGYLLFYPRFKERKGSSLHYKEGANLTHFFRQILMRNLSSLLNF